MKNYKEKTIEDFGVQWSKYTDNHGYYGNVNFLKDFLEPLVKVEDIKNKKVADVGSGTGRIVNMLIEAGASHVTAIEPSKCFDVLKKNTAKYSDKIEYLNAPGESIPSDADFDFVVSFGVIHHIPQPEIVIDAIYKALKPGGKVVIWLYGKEGNEMYLSIIKPLRIITRVLPDTLLSILAWTLTLSLVTYEWCCKILPLPMHVYINNVINRLTLKQKKLTIFDQLNPTWAKYYSKREAFSLFKEKWKNVKEFNRHNYSWTIVAEK